MPFITSVERIGFEIGFKMGFEIGQRKALLEVLPLFLKLRFGQSGLDLVPAVQQQSNVGVLRAVLRAMETASLDELRRMLGQANVAGTPPV